MEKLKKVFQKNRNAKILDVGTGNGNFIKIITSLTSDFSEIIGIDIIKVSIDGCKETFLDKRINFFQMDAMKTDFDDNTFDYVCLSNSLHHLEDIRGIIKEMERVLKPGGEIVICEMMSNNLSKRQKSHLLMHHYAAEIDRDRGRFHGATFTNNEIIEILQKNSNLNILEVWDLTYPTKESNSLEEIEWLFETIDRVKENIIDPKKREYFEKGADKVRKHIKKYGFDSATQLIVLLK